MLLHTDHGTQTELRDNCQISPTGQEVAVVTKIVVIKEPGGGQVPFLRGILVQSLLSAGLSFKDAYGTAQAIRKSLANATVITTAELRARVAKQLEKDFSRALRHAYEAETEHQQTIIVSSPRGDSPFSAGILTRSLEACLIDRKPAIEIALRVQDLLPLMFDHQQFFHQKINHQGLVQYKLLQLGLSK